MLWYCWYDFSRFIPRGLHISLHQEQLANSSVDWRRVSVILGEYLVDKPSTAEFRVKSMPEDLTESLLVMIIAVAARIIHTTNIKDSIQCIKDLQQSSTRKGGIQVSAIAGCIN
jgi:ERCC4-type nuclease